MEDLWAFNEEIVADAVFQAITPIVSAVGHEIDWVISDFVADARAATPSVAMQMCLPDANELYQSLDSLSSSLTQALSQKIFVKKQELTHLLSSYSQHSMERKLSQKTEEVKRLKEIFVQSLGFKIQSASREIEHVRLRFPHAVDSIVALAQSRVTNLQKTLELNNPKLKSRVGFAQLSQKGRVVDVSSLNMGDDFEAQNGEFSIVAKVTDKIKT